MFPRPPHSHYEKSQHSRILVKAGQGSSTERLVPAWSSHESLGAWVCRFVWRLSLLQPNSSPISFHHSWLFWAHMWQFWWQNLGHPCVWQASSSTPPSDGNQIAPILNRNQDSTKLQSGGKTRVPSGCAWDQIEMPGFENRQKARGKSTLSRRNTNQETNI